MHFRYIVRFFLLVTAGIILYFSLIPDPPNTFIKFNAMDKVEHAVAYALLGLLSFFSFRYDRNHPVRIVIFSVLLCSIYGGLIEILQRYTGRFPDSGDLIMDIIGATAGSLLAFFILRYISKKKAQ